MNTDQGLKGEKGHSQIIIHSQLVLNEIKLIKERLQTKCTSSTNSSFSIGVFLSNVLDLLTDYMV